MIKIKTEKIIENGKKKRKIISVEGLLEHGELPEEYTEAGDSCYRLGDTICISTEPVNPIIGSTYSEEAIQRYLGRIKKCGERLHSINKKIALLKQRWVGEETFII